MARTRIYAQHDRVNLYDSYNCHGWHMQINNTHPIPRQFVQIKYEEKRKLATEMRYFERIEWNNIIEESPVQFEKMCFNHFLHS